MVICINIVIKLLCWQCLLALNSQNQLNPHTVGIMHLSLHLSNLDFLPHFPLPSIPFASITPLPHALSFLPQTQLLSVPPSPPPPSLPPCWPVMWLANQFDSLIFAQKMGEASREPIFDCAEEAERECVSVPTGVNHL